MSQSEIHASIKRSSKANLYDPLTKQPNTKALFEFLVHGLKYVFPASIGTEVRGMPTAHSGPPLVAVIVADEADKYVWPTADGNTRGFALEPLYRCVPAAAAKSPRLYELLVLVDALRVGRAREQKLAADELAKRLRL